MGESIVVARITVEGDGAAYILSLPQLTPQNLSHLFSEAEPGDWYRFEMSIMDKDEFDSLPEFDGF